MEGAGKGRSRGRARVTDDPSAGGGHRQGGPGGNGSRGRDGGRGDGGRGYGDRGGGGGGGSSSRGYGDRSDGGGRGGNGERGDGGGRGGYGDRRDGGGRGGYGDRAEGGRGYGDRSHGGDRGGDGGGDRSQRPAWGAPAGRGDQSEASRAIYQSQPGPSQPRPQAPPQTQAQGRATVHRAPDGGGTQGGMRGVKRNTSGEIEDGRLNESKYRKTDVGRGAVRGRRVIPEFLRSKPQEMNTKVGTTGFPISLQANYFCLKKRPEWNIFQYRIDFEEEIEMMDVRKKIMYLLKHLYGGYIFDGTILSITSKLSNDEFSELIEKPSGDGTVTVKFKYVGTVSMDTSNSLQFLNLILRRALQGLSLDLIGRNYYDSAAARRVDQNSYDLWPGYLTSIRQHETELLVCCEIVHKVVRRDTAYDVLMNIRRSGGDIPTRYKNEIMGQTVMTNYNKKTYRIDDVDFTKSPMSTFDQNGVQISFVQYYKTRYNITIRDEKQPLLLSRAKDRDIRAGKIEVMALIPELCLCTGFTNEMVADKRFMRAAQDVARLNPDGRVRALQAFNRRLLETPASINHLKEWNLILDNKLVDIPGRIYQPQTIFFGNNKHEVLNENADWTNHFIKHQLYRGVKLERWTVIAYDRVQGDLQQFLANLKKVSQGMRFDLRDPQIEYAQNDRVQTYNSVIEKVAARNDPQMIMVVVSNDNADRYSNIKKKTCVDRAIPTQVIQSRNMIKGGKLAVATKVAIQMNCKLGGTPWFIDFPPKGVMTIGYDVCHDPRDKSQSWGAMVATMDFSERIQFFSTVQKHTSGEELSNSLVLNVQKALAQFRLCHNTLPARILMYRDGVGDGQLHFVHEHEVKVLEQKLKEIYQTANDPNGAKLFYCIVSKRINTRIFRTVRNAADNPGPGTVVDDVITLPERFDFFLISQSVRQGTVSPTSYNVLFNTSKWAVDRLQLVTYRMCHLYFNWSGTTRVPALCQYAHKLAFLVSQSIHQTPSSALENKLYFL